MERNPVINLKPVKDMPTWEVGEFLYRMLRDRDPNVSISHKNMPTWDEHASFVASNPYKSWYIIALDDTWIGQIYLTYRNEIGIHLVKDRQRHGYGKAAIGLLMQRTAGVRRYLANIAPNNVVSQQLFQRMGFKMIQFTYELEFLTDEWPSPGNMANLSEQGVLQTPVKRSLFEHEVVDRLDKIIELLAWSNAVTRKYIVERIDAQDQSDPRDLMGRTSLRSDSSVWPPSP